MVYVLATKVSDVGLLVEGEGGNCDPFYSQMNE